MKNNWKESSAVVVALLILFFPAGLFFMWKYANWKKPVKGVISAIFAFLLIVSAFSPKNYTKTPDINTKPIESKTVVTTSEPEVTKPGTPTPEVTKAPVATNIEAAAETVSQKNAVRKAKSYLEYSAFSHDGLVAQLEYEKFSHADSLYGANNCGANWNEQAAKKAKSYMDYSAFSRDGLIAQLKYEKFTQKEAEYGANAVGL